VTKASLDVLIVDDNVLESLETFDLTINQSSLPTGFIVGNPGQVVVTIKDDESKCLIRCLIFSRDNVHRMAYSNTNFKAIGINY